MFKTFRVCARSLLSSTAMPFLPDAAQQAQRPAANRLRLVVPALSAIGLIAMPGAAMAQSVGGGVAPASGSTTVGTGATTGGTGGATNSVAIGQGSSANPTTGSKSGATAIGNSAKACNEDVSVDGPTTTGFGTRATPTRPVSQRHSNRPSILNPPRLYPG